MNEINFKLFSLELKKLRYNRKGKRGISYTRARYKIDYVFPSLKLS